MERNPAKPPGRAPDGSPITLMIFPVARYLNDPVFRQAAIKSVLHPSDIGKADQLALRTSPPIPSAELKRLPNVDAYGLMALYDTLVRTHIVTTNGVARTNPPPEDYLCDSCHTKGWLKQEFQNSKLDGANISVWLCAKCSKSKPEERGVRF